MCGIVGYLDKSGGQSAVGERLLAMLTALACRGPDSSGIAIWGPPSRGVKVRAAGLAPDRIPGIVEALRPPITAGALVSLEVVGDDSTQVACALEAAGPGVRLVSLGRRLEIVKQVGAPTGLEAIFGVSRMPGSHGLGHTRLSTESRIDLSHSQPFWAHGTLDLAVVHNGHITNYHRLRRMYEQDGVRFFTENDSEIIGVYLAGKLREGAALVEAMEASVVDLDGSFSYIVATAEEFGFAKDSFCLKPLIVGEDADAIAIANEEIALHAVLRDPYTAREAGAGLVTVWKAGTLA